MEIFIGVIIADICFIGVAFLVNEKNAKYLLSGYNTMSKEEQESFDLKNYIIFFKKFFINLAIYSSLIYLTSYIVFEEASAAIIYCISILVTFPYIIYKGNKFKIKK